MEIEAQARELLDQRMLVTVFAYWHHYRGPILLLAVAVLLAASSVLLRRQQGLRTSSLPPPSSPAFRDKKNECLETNKEPQVEQKRQLPDPLRNNALAVRKKVKVAQRRIGSSRGPNQVAGSRATTDASSKTLVHTQIQPMIFFSSLTGSTEKFANEFADEVRAWSERHTSSMASPKVHNLSYIDYDDYFTAPPQQTSPSSNVLYFYIVFLPSYDVDTMITNFLDHLRETHHDFRVDTAPLSSLAGYSVFGFGDKERWKTEEEGFCSQAVAVDKWLAKLTGRKRAFPLGTGDVKSDASAQLDGWRKGILDCLLDIAIHGSLGEGVPGSGDPAESEDEETEEAKEGLSPEQAASKKRFVNGKLKISNVDDLEDLGGKASSKSSNVVSKNSSSRGPVPADFSVAKNGAATSPEPQAMVPVSSPTYAALTKQGYAIIGSHSGVKICRWTKSALRGRGSCYKYSFYGIKSHLCMETTPSLSCSNKCVFCWRHGTNPIGTTWRWKVDPPEMIFSGAQQAHLKKIKMMRGVPGVRAERFQEAMKIRHCALSLVGEPIFYPHINEFLQLLHQNQISSFLVCNAQHPDQLEALQAVTQLYVSIDASNRESLRKVDRPLHRDFWERFLQCLDTIREKRFRMRTVYRLTLVKGFNIEDEAEGYADLVARGLPCFVEVKGVTYCGTASSAGAGLTMQNVPFYNEVIAFVEALDAALARRGLDYGIAAEHAHSCCILLASKRFFIDGRWHTVIDYEKFFQCLESGKDFAPEDYVGPPTPQWASWGNGGFDPADERVDRKGKPKNNEAAKA